MGFWIFIMAANLIVSAWAEKLTYYAPEPSFEIERNTKSLTMKTYVHNLQVAIKPCNQTLVDQFWKNAVHQFERQPKIRGVPKVGEYAELGSQRRAVLPGPVGEGLRLTDQEFIALAALEKRQCSK